MGLVIAIGITLVVMGSVLWIKPSLREKTITEMRTRALGLGLKVRLLDEKLASSMFPWVDNYRLYTLYEAQLKQDQKPGTPKAIVVRLNYSEDVHELDRADDLRDSLVAKGVFDSQPDTAEAIVISLSGIALLWRENIEVGPDAVEQARVLLDRCIECSDLWV